MPMKYDCTKTVDFIHEIKRMYDSCTEISNEPCQSCPISGLCGEGFAEYLTEGHIETVQKWSDEHPEMSRMDWFLKQFPNCKMVYPQYIPEACVASLSSNFKCPISDGQGCTACWHEPYREEDF